MFRLVYVEITASADLLKVLYANRKFHILVIWVGLFFIYLQSYTFSVKQLLNNNKKSYKLTKNGVIQSIMTPFSVLDGLPIQYIQKILLAM